MPHNVNGVYYQPPINLAGLQVAPRIVSADVSVPTTAASLEDAKDIFARLDIHEFYVTALTGNHNDLAFIAKAVGTAPTVTMTYVDPSANNAALSVSVTGEAITVNLATGAAGAITSTAAQIKAAIEAHAAANALVYVNLAASNDGTGVVTALATQTLAGPAGTSPTIDVKFKHGIDASALTLHGTAFTQANAAGSEFKAFATVASYGQWLLDVGGTNPVFAVSITAQHRP